MDVRDLEVTGVQIEVTTGNLIRDDFYRLTLCPYTKTLLHNIMYYLVWPIYVTSRSETTEIAFYNPHFKFQFKGNLERANGRHIALRLRQYQEYMCK